MKRKGERENEREVAEEVEMRLTVEKKMRELGKK